MHSACTTERGDSSKRSFVVGTAVASGVCVCAHLCVCVCVHEAKPNKVAFSTLNQVVKLRGLAVSS